MGLSKTGISCFETPRVKGYKRVPDPPASMMPRLLVWLIMMLKIHPITSGLKEPGARIAAPPARVNGKVTHTRLVSNGALIGARTCLAPASPASERVQPPLKVLARGCFT